MNGRRDRGLLSTELAILMPIMVIFALLAVYVVQVERHSSRAQQAADAAARAASLAPDGYTARIAAQTAAAAVCDGIAVIDDEGFVYQPAEIDTFTPGSVTVYVSCTEPFEGFRPLLNDRSRTETGRAISVIEYFRPGS